MIIRCSIHNLTNYLIFAIMLLVFASASPASLRIQNKRVSQEFKVLRNDAGRLKSIRNSRENQQRYQEVIYKIHRFIKSHPRNEHILSAMILVAELYEKLAKTSNGGIYRSKAARAYLAVARKFKGNPHAARALKKANYLAPKPKKFAKRPGVRRRVLDIQKSEGSDGIKILLRLDGLVKVKSGEIPANGRFGRRFFVDLTPAVVPKKFKSIDIAKFGLKKIRSGQFNNNTARIVFELESGATVLPFFDKPTDRVVFGVRGKPSNLAQPKRLAKKISPPVKKWTKRPSLLLPKLTKVVIDPGHGGSDPGAVSASGVMEKTLTLAIARKIARHIRARLPNVKVFMTRNSDKSVSLSERTDYANRLNADLFISVHINSSKNKHGEGIETYYLDITHDRYALRLSARENATSESQITDLEYILADLATKSNTQDSIRLGESVQRAMLTKVQRRWRDTKDLGLKHALFYVLLGAKMPAILIETSFISNKKELVRLKSKRYQDALAIGVVRGIKRYVEEIQASYVP